MIHNECLKQVFYFNCRSLLKIVCWFNDLFNGKYLYIIDEFVLTTIKNEIEKFLFYSSEKMAN